MHMYIYTMKGRPGRDLHISWAGHVRVVASFFADMFTDGVPGCFHFLSTICRCSSDKIVSAVPNLAMVPHQPCIIKRKRLIGKMNSSLIKVKPVTIDLPACFQSSAMSWNPSSQLTSCIPVSLRASSQIINLDSDKVTYFGHIASALPKMDGGPQCQT